MPVETNQDVIRQPHQAKGIATLDHGAVASPQGKAIYDHFQQDVWENQKIEAPSSFFGKIAPWLFSPKAQETQGTAPLSEIDIQKAEPIQPVPELEKPEFPEEASLEGFVPKVPFSLKKSGIIEDDIVFGLSNMNAKTIDQIIVIILKAQMELEREGAELTQNSFEKLTSIRKIQEKTVDDIRAALEKDKNIASKLNTAQKLLLAVSLICTVCSFITALPAIPAIVPFITSLGSGLTTAGQGYFKARTQEDTKNLKLREFQREQTSTLSEEYWDSIVNFGEKDAHFKEEFVKLLKILERIKNQVLQK